MSNDNDSEREMEPADVGSPCPSSMENSKNGALIAALTRLFHQISVKNYWTKRTSTSCEEEEKNMWSTRLGVATCDVIANLMPGQQVMASNCDRCPKSFHLRVHEIASTAFPQQPGTEKTQSLNMMELFRSTRGGGTCHKYCIKIQWKQID